MLQRALNALNGVHSHRGGSLTRLGLELREVLVNLGPGVGRASDLGELAAPGEHMDVSEEVVDAVPDVPVVPSVTNDENVSHPRPVPMIPPIASRKLVNSLKRVSSKPAFPIPVSVHRDDPQATSRSLRPSECNLSVSVPDLFAKQSISACLRCDAKESAYSVRASWQIM